MKPSLMAETVRFFTNIALTIVYELAMFLQKVVFNYFGGFLILIFVMVGEYHQFIKVKVDAPQHV
jgi:hypothetical protein